MTPEQAEFLKARRLGSLATGRRDGSPQQSLIAYEFDSTDIVLQTGGGSAKARNVGRVPAVSLLVQDGGRYLVVQGTAEIVASGAERRAAIRRARASGRNPASDDDATLDAELDENGSVAMRIVPGRAMGRIEERPA
jgi:PPOX class probable F420-dependent enzyme